MPELPEVEVFKQYLDATALHQNVKRVEVRDTRILGDTSLHSLNRKLKGRSIDSSRRHGKYLFCLLDGGALVLHFGMSGFLTYFKGEENREEADYNQMLLYFNNEYGWPTTAGESWVWSTGPMIRTGLSFNTISVPTASIWTWKASPHYWRKGAERSSHFS